MQWAPLDGNDDDLVMSGGIEMSSGFLSDMRLAPIIPRSDLSGNLSYDFIKLSMMNSAEEVAHEDKLQMDVKLIMNDFKQLKSTLDSLKNEIETCKKNISDVKEAEKKFNEGLLEMKSHIGFMALLPVDTVKTILNQSHEIQTEVHNGFEKILLHLNNDKMNLEIKYNNVAIKLSTYSEFMKTGIKEMVGPDVKPNQCTICWENEVRECLVPCGHTFCSDCIKKSKDKACMTCRATYSTKVKFYL